MHTKGSFVSIGEVEYYKIENSQNLPPFFIQVASSSDIWIFLSSTGGLTAGRKNSENNIFPYTTDDKLFNNSQTGSITIIKKGADIWIPFDKYPKYNITRNIYKSLYANGVILEEINEDLGLKFSYKLEPSEKYGIVKTSKLSNLTDKKIKIEILDGFNNILPFGVNPVLEANSSTLVDAYKASELCGKKLGIFSLTSIVNDTPNPLEMLKANVAYTTLEGAKIYLNPDIIPSFLNAEDQEVSAECYGKKCGYFAVFEQEISKSSPAEYSFVLDVGYSHSDIANIENFANSSDFSKLFEDIEKGKNDIIDIVKSADGVAVTGDKIATSSHYLSTLYNVMRGGTFEKGYSFDYDLFYSFISKRNKKALENVELLKEIKQVKDISEFKEIAKKDDVLYRLALEFMPLSFSRRHGDPSRPWNKFNISLKDENGEKTVNFEGNWRDIFQNWEALGLSFPLYFDNMVAKFVNASTFDGFNPYRINNDGIEWEVPEPENPFGGLGYWGDHQIIYLLRLLERLSEHYPDTLKSMLKNEVFSYANVPYKIKDYSEILKDGKNTIDFDFERHNEIERLVENFGTDGKLLLKNGEVYTVSLAEKLLVPLLSKISNLLPGGGIWMNTQRPEWNDGNNAIVGIGLSVITVYHTKAYLEFLKKLFDQNDGGFNFSKEVKQWLFEIKGILKEFESSFKGNEKTVLDKMGESFSNYRNKVYSFGFSEKQTIEKADISEFIKSALALVDYTIEQNKGDIFVGYNLLKQDFSFSPMKPMLEGQSAIIASGHLVADEVCKLINNMEQYLLDKQEGYHTLYPIKKTTRFIDKNIVDDGIPEISGLIERDKTGKKHFNANIISEAILLEYCERFNVSNEHTKRLIAEFERVFSHKKFNGRSDVMYKFEGIGCVYWHQNAKFALGVLETAQKASQNGEDVSEILFAYNKLLDGFIYRKTPKQCKAIPIEPYSHTSFNKKSEQPGMTGQVKESVIMRRGELGVTVKDGRISFNPLFLRKGEFDQNGEISFSVCAISCKYVKSKDKIKGIAVHTKQGVENVENYSLTKDISELVFKRSEKIKLIEVFV